MFENNDIYRSQADLAANSFTQPMNANIGGSGWGIDQNQLTPSYTSPYRPQWSGNGGQYDYTKAGMFSSANRLMPWYPNGYSAPQDMAPQNINSFVESPFDVASFVVQRIAAPLLAFKAANHMFGPGSFMGAFKGEGIGAAAGKSVAKGLSTGFLRGAGLSAVNAGRIGSVIGGVGSAVGAVAVPFTAAMTMLNIAERGVFNPYINNMKTAESLRQNFSGISFSDAEGSYSTGRGFSYKESMKMSQDITQMGIKDKLFSTGDFRSLADMGMRSGMFDNAKAGDITRRVKEMSEQIKLVMAISKDPSIQGAIESLSRLQMSGATGSKVFGAYTQLGLKASIAGSSVQRMMDTVGAQGEYLYRQNGMTPYLGQLAAANSYSAFASANRMGLISSEQLARMGGLEGATQSSVTAQLNASQTTLGKFMSFNTYLGKGGSNNLIGSVANFGASMANDPTNTLGQMALYGNQASAKMMHERGTMAMEDQIMQIARNLPNGTGPDGKVSAETAAVIMKNMMNLGDSEIHAFLNQRLAETNPESFKAGIKARESFIRDQHRTYIDQNNLYGGVIGTTIGQTMKAGSYMTGFAARHIVEPITGKIDLYKDVVAAVRDNLTVGSALTGKTVNINSMEGQLSIFGKEADLSPGITNRISTPKGGWNKVIAELGGDGEKTVANNKVIEKLNSAYHTDKSVKKAIDDLQALQKNPNATDRDREVVRSQLENVLRKSIRDSGQGEHFPLNRDVSSLASTITHSRDNKVITEISSEKISLLNDRLSDAIGTKDKTLYDNMVLAGDAYQLTSHIPDGGLGSMTEEQFKELTGSTEFKRLKTAYDPHTDKALDKEIETLKGMNLSEEELKNKVESVEQRRTANNRGILDKITLHAKKVGGTNVNKTLLYAARTWGSTDDNIRNNFKNITDKGLKKEAWMVKEKFDRKEITEQDYKKQIGNIMVEQAARVTGGNVLSESSIPDNSSISDVLKFTRMGNEASRDNFKSFNESTSGIELSGYEKSMNKLDKSVDTFAAAVNVFAEASGSKAKVSVPVKIGYQNTSDDWAKK